jgi:hypothetical protein
MDNDIHFMDSTYKQIVKVMSNGTGEVVLPRQGGAGSASTLFARPHSHFCDQNQTCYIADTENHQIQMWLAGATSGTTIAGARGVSASDSAHLSSPYAVVVDDNGYESLYK